MDLLFTECTKSLSLSYSSNMEVCTKCEEPKEIRSYGSTIVEVGNKEPVSFKLCNDCTIQFWNDAESQELLEDDFDRTN